MMYSSSNSEWTWQEGTVDSAGEHIEIRYGDASRAAYDEWVPVARVGRPTRRIFPVQWTLTEAANASAVSAVRQELDFYLVSHPKGYPATGHPWDYAVYHCGTAANIYSQVHWSYFPSGQQGERLSSMLVQLPADDAVAHEESIAEEGTSMPYASIDELFIALRDRLSEPGYKRTYGGESAFERDVWSRVWNVMEPAVRDVKACCLTSHTELPGRSAAEWKAFCKENRGPDVKALGSNNRLDIVVRLPDKSGSVGIEVKWLGAKGHAEKLTQGIGQAILALAHRDRTLLMIHCGTVAAEERRRLRQLAEGMSREMERFALIVVP